MTLRTADRPSRLLQALDAAAEDPAGGPVQKRAVAGLGPRCGRNIRPVKYPR